MLKLTSGSDPGGVCSDAGAVGGVKATTERFRTEISFHLQTVVARPLDALLPGCDWFCKRILFSWLFDKFGALQVRCTRLVRQLIEYLFTYAGGK